MQNLSRAEFLKMGAAGLAASLVPSRAWSGDNAAGEEQDTAFLQELVANNDLAVGRYMDPAGRAPRAMYFRSLSEEFASLTASYCQSRSTYYRSATVLTRLNVIIRTLARAQYPDGTLDAGGNRQSPPDTAFLTDHLCPACTVLANDPSAEAALLKKSLMAFLINIGNGLRTGGVHTPNHRWEVCAALARVYALHHDEGYVRRIDEWLAEGIDINGDGNYSERSRTYAVVVNNSLLTIGRLLNRPSLFAPVRQNLLTTYYYAEANGDLVTLESRRQDQYSTVSIHPYYLFYRFLALRDGDEALGGIAQHVSTLPDFDRRVLARSLVFCMENPLLLQRIKATKAPVTGFTKLFPLSGLARIRRENITASIFGGTDKPVMVASGRSTNPTFFALRRGSAVLEYIRMSTSFFNTGYFRSDGLQGDGDTYTLRETKEAFYYQPLPSGHRDAGGKYELSESLDGRFWSTMAFASRTTTRLALDLSVTIKEENGTFSMRCRVDGPGDVEVTIECCFRGGGRLEGVAPAHEADDYFLQEGYARYSSGTDVIEIGPGIHEHANIRMLDGEEYATHFGSIKGKGMHVYLTGTTPFDHTLTIR
jgi:hypothetical protein